MDDLSKELERAIPGWQWVGPNPRHIAPNRWDGARGDWLISIMLSNPADPLDVTSWSAWSFVASGFDPEFQKWSRSATAFAAASDAAEWCASDKTALAEPTELTAEFVREDCDVCGAEGDDGAIVLRIGNAKLCGACLEWGRKLCAERQTELDLETRT